MPSKEQVGRLNNILNTIVPLCASTRYPPLVLSVQWILESGYGTKESGENNVLGITWTKLSPFSYSWCPTHECLTAAQIEALPREEKATVVSIKPIKGVDNLFEVFLKRRFNNYDSEAECLGDKIDLIKMASRYKRAYNRWLEDYDKDRLLYYPDRDLVLLTSICDAGYATDIKYKSTVLAIAKQKSIIESVTYAIANFHKRKGR